MAGLRLFAGSERPLDTDTSGKFVETRPVAESVLAGTRHVYPDVSALAYSPAFLAVVWSPLAVDADHSGTLSCESIRRRAERCLEGVDSRHNPTQATVLLQAYEVERVRDMERAARAEAAAQICAARFRAARAHRRLRSLVIRPGKGTPTPVSGSVAGRRRVHGPAPGSSTRVRAQSEPLQEPLRSDAHTSAVAAGRPSALPARCLLGASSTATPPAGAGAAAASGVARPAAALSPAEFVRLQRQRSQREKNKSQQ